MSGPRDPIFIVFRCEEAVRPFFGADHLPDSLKFVSPVAFFLLYYCMEVMNMKGKRLLPVVIGLLLTSCGSYQNTIANFDDRAYSADLDKVRTSAVSGEIRDFKLNAYLNEDGGNYVYTAQIVYAETELRSLKAIFVPDTGTENVAGILPCIGYSESLTLAEKKDPSAFAYTGYNLSYKTDKEDLDFYLFVSYEEGNEYLYRIEDFLRLGV